jgi:NTP pyrophosphatase (non-canonical NTP hydrolase)
MLQHLYEVACGLNRRFPDGQEPFKIITRLTEEAGELAAEINHFEDTGIKRLKHGEPDRAHLAKEVQDVLRAALSIVIYYGIEAELEQSIQASYASLLAEGWIEPPAESTGHLL